MSKRDAVEQFLSILRGDIQVTVIPLDPLKHAGALMASLSGLQESVTGFLK